ncbi:MAG TPA: cation:dicarboxylase symporter family transporter [Methanocorpusculum sp.]|nr:cation:dicarboxylase symporter family transporter [Methanocorpusculum sp.]
MYFDPITYVVAFGALVVSALWLRDTYIYSKTGLTGYRNAAYHGVLFSALGWFAVAVTCLSNTLFLYLGCGIVFLALFFQSRVQIPRKSSHNFSCPTPDPDEILKTILQGLNTEKPSPISEKTLSNALRAVLQAWEPLQKTKSLSCHISRSLKQPQVTLILPGQEINPLLSTEIEGCSVTTLFSTAALHVSYKYQNGENRLTIRLNRKKPAPYIPLLCAATTGIATGLLCRYILPTETVSTLRNFVLTPLFDTFLEILVVIALPMIFFSLIVSLAGFGTIEKFRTIGTTILTRYLLRILLALGIALILCLPFVPLSLGGGVSGSGEFQSLFSMFLSIIPSSLFTPFIDRQPLQIIFLAILFGYVILLIHRSIPDVITFLSQADYLMQQVMTKIVLFLPVFIFLSMFRLILTDQDFSGLGLLFLLILGCHLIHLTVMGAEISFIQKLPPITLTRKLLPSFLIALTTASSAAALPINMRVCQDQCGISKKLAEFGVPLGTAFSRAGIATEYFCVSLFMAAYFGIPISISWLIITVTVVFLVSIAGVPVPCGNLINYPIVFSQLGIPLDAMAFAIVIAVIMDYMNTAVNMVAVPVDLIQAASKLDMLDESILRSDC